MAFSLLRRRTKESFAVIWSLIEKLRNPGERGGGEA
jgi:hypothetical protein